jgi:hypothetical protein
LIFAEKELLPFRGFFVDFDLAGLKIHPGAGFPWPNFYSSDAFCIPNLRSNKKTVKDFKINFEILSSLFINLNTK